MEATTTGDILNLLPALPEIFLVLVGMALLMVGVFGRDPEGSVADQAAVARLVNHLAIAALAVTLVLVLAVAPDARITTFGGMFVLDGYAVFFKVLVLIASVLSLLLSRQYLELVQSSRFEYSALIVFSAVGMMMMISANDFLALYIGLELQSLCLYVIATFQRDEVRSSEAGLKYFILSSLASGILLYGITLIYGFSGTINFDVLGEVFAGYGGEVPPLGILTGLMFILAGLAFKVSAVPFHMWTPDVYEGAPTPATAFFSVGPKLAAVALLMRVMMEPFGGLVDQWQQVIVLISIASMLVGAFAAIVQTNIKRLMAYSSIGHVGYALMGLAAGSEAGVRGVMIYMAIYLFMNLGAFACILSMRRRDTMVMGIGDLAGLSKTQPLVALALAVFMFSLAGVPPVAGFFAKLYIFFAAVDAGLVVLAVIGVLSSVVAAYYYLRIVKIMYFDEATQPLDRAVSREVGWVMLATGVVVLLFFLYPEPLLANAASAASALLGS
ncbi:MAG: NADH-quinone oxidoreductase subunit NuoN [Rhodospirillales bacterium]|nr:MAG: NADH-quinone oxidoreductase subunit NuoN [Rhodospirillales bacterium]